MCLVPKRNDSSPNPVRMIHAQLMEMPMKHGFAPDQHQVRFDCPIFKKPGSFKTEALRLVNGVEATENETLKIGVAWKIKHLFRKHHGIFYEFQFRQPYQTCLSTIILNQLTIDSFVLSKTPGIIIENDSTGAFYRSINWFELIALCILGFSIIVIRMLGLIWRKRKCYIKIGFGISERYYQSSISKQSLGHPIYVASSTAYSCTPLHHHTLDLKCFPCPVRLYTSGFVKASSMTQVWWSLHNRLQRSPPHVWNVSHLMKTSSFIAQRKWFNSSSNFSKLLEEIWTFTNVHASLSFAVGKVDEPRCFARMTHIIPWK
jgi:hypothetical protein